MIFESRSFLRGVSVFVGGLWCRLGSSLASLALITLNFKDILQ